VSIPVVPIAAKTHELSCPSTHELSCPFSVNVVLFIFTADLIILTANDASKCIVYILTANDASKCIVYILTANDASKCRVYTLTANDASKCIVYILTANDASKCTVYILTANDPLLNHLQGCCVCWLHGGPDSPLPRALHDEGQGRLEQPPLRY